jgi:hypothetical protein
MVEIETICVRLGEREYTIAQAGFARARPWKQRLFAEVKPLFERLNGAGEMAINSPSDLLQLIPVAEDLFVEGLDTIFDLLLTYAPALGEDRAYIEEHATDKQILTAFQEVVVLADPFGVVAQMNRTLGRRTNGTS